MGGMEERVGGMKEGKKSEWEEGRRVRGRERGNKGGWKSYGRGRQPNTVTSQFALLNASIATQSIINYIEALISEQSKGEGCP